MHVFFLSICPARNNTSLICSRYAWIFGIRHHAVVGKGRFSRSAAVEVLRENTSYSYEGPRGITPYRELGRHGPPIDIR